MAREGLLLLGVDDFLELVPQLVYQRLAILLRKFKVFPLLMVIADLLTEDLLRLPLADLARRIDRRVEHFPNFLS
jgi:hypothetical protein